MEQVPSTATPPRASAAAGKAEILRRMAAVREQAAKTLPVAANAAEDRSDPLMHQYLSLTAEAAAAQTEKRRAEANERVESLLKMFEEGGPEPIKKKLARRRHVQLVPKIDVEAVRRLNKRFEAVCRFDRERGLAGSDEAAAIQTCKDLGCAKTTLLEWVAHYRENGIAGLFENLRGVVGRKPKALNAAGGDSAPATATPG